MWDRQQWGAQTLMGSQEGVCAEGRGRALFGCLWGLPLLSGTPPASGGSTCTPGCWVRTESCKGEWRGTLSARAGVAWALCRHLPGQPGSLQSLHHDLLPCQASVAAGSSDPNLKNNVACHSPSQCQGLHQTPTPSLSGACHVIDPLLPRKRGGLPQTCPKLCEALPLLS